MEEIEFESRQVRRAFERMSSARSAAHLKEYNLANAKRALLERQTRREKSGFYGRPVAEAISQSRSRVTKRKVKKGTAFCRILRTTTENGREWQFHATKGWRSYAPS